MNDVRCNQYKRTVNGTKLKSENTWPEVWSDSQCAEYKAKLQTANTNEIFAHLLAA
jgi:hypothetical protein